MQPGQIVWREIKALLLGEEQAGFVGGKAQVGGAQLGELPAPAPHGAQGGSQNMTAVDAGIHLRRFGLNDAVNDAPECQQLPEPSGSIDRLNLVACMKPELLSQQQVINLTGSF